MGSEYTTSSYLDPPQLIGRPNADGTISITPLELKKLNDYNYYVAKMLQGGLNLANLNEATNETFTGMVKFVDLSDPTKSTVIDGSHITTGTLSADRVSGGTLEGVTLISSNPGYPSQTVAVESGTVNLGGGIALLEYDGSNTKLTSYFVPLKIESLMNLAIDSGGTIYIGTSAGKSGDVSIGQVGGNVNLIGNVSVNGVPI